MKYFAECIPCHFGQAQRISCELDLSPEDRAEFYIGLCKSFSELPPVMKPVEVAEYLYRVVEAQFRTRDVFRSSKALANQIALDVLKTFKSDPTFADRPLHFYAKLAAASNIIDLGAHEVDLDRLHHSLVAGAHRDFVIDHFESFEKALTGAKTLLYILDNAGEIVFDSWLIQEIKRRFSSLEVIAAVRSTPVINDVTMDDARQVGLTEICPVVDSGSSLPGTVLTACSQRFRDLFQKADLILSKGQGNFEGLCQEPKEGLFLSLTAKCDPVSQFLGIEKGRTVWISQKWLSQRDQQA